MRYYKSICLALTAVGLFFTLLFLINRSNWSFCNPLDTEAVGQYGDFVGGVIGTLITIVLLYVTFTLQRQTFDEQREVSRKSIDLTAVQRMNDKFFSLFRIYQDTVANFYAIKGDEYLRGKDAVRQKADELLENFDANANPSYLRKNATREFLTKFYAVNSDFASVYFRLLYRMLDELERTDDVTHEQRIRYIKILRSQFTEAELMLIRYNAMTEMGANFRKYINKYNLLKHLPPMDLLEFKNWLPNNVSKEQMQGMNMVLLSLRKSMVKALNGEKVLDIKGNSERYRLKVIVSPHYDSIETVLIRQTDKR